MTREFVFGHMRCRVVTILRRLFVSAGKPAGEPILFLTVLSSPPAGGTVEKTERQPGWLPPGMVVLACQTLQTIKKCI